MLSASSCLYSRLTTYDSRFGSPPMTRRTQQMSEFLREEVVDIIRSEIDDPRLGFWTVTRVEVLPDLRSARIYVSVLGTEGERKETITALRGAVHPRASQAAHAHPDHS